MRSPHGILRAALAHKPTKVLATMLLALQAVASFEVPVRSMLLASQPVAFSQAPGRGGLHRGLISSLRRSALHAVASAGTVVERPRAQSETARRLQRQGGGGEGGGAAGGGGSGGGGGGGEAGDGGNMFIRSLSPAEQKMVIGDWMSKSKVYRMTTSLGGDPTIGEAHNAQLESLSKLRIVSRRPNVEIVALFMEAPERGVFLLAEDETDKILGIVAVEEITAPDLTQTFQCFALHPTALNADLDERYENLMDFFEALNVYAEDMADVGFTIDFSPIESDPYLKQFTSDEHKIFFNNDGGGDEWYYDDFHLPFSPR